MATEAQPKYWTYDDLRALPDDGNRYEIIDGVLYKMARPSLAHARAISLLLHRVLWPAAEPLGGQPYPSCVSVFVGGANPVIPDSLILLPEQLHYESDREIEGPPTLIVEVLSPSNSEHDLITKRALYAHAGVPEYWIGSPEAMSIEVLTLDGNLYRTHARLAGDDTLTSPTFPTIAIPISVIFEW